MAKGAQDWFTSWPPGGITATIDISQMEDLLAEILDELVAAAVVDIDDLAVLLGGPYIPDRAGDLFGFYDFELGILPWDTSAPGTDGEVARSTTTCRSGIYSVKCTTGSEDYFDAGIGLYVAPLPKGEIGLLAHLSWDNDYIFHYLRIRDFETDASREYGFAYDAVNDRVQVYEEPATWTTVAENVNFYKDYILWIPIKLVVDIENHAYVKGIIGDKEYDLSAYTPDLSAGQALRRTDLWIIGNGREGHNDVYYIDDVAITINE